MRQSSKLKRFVLFQAIVLLITMFLCIFLSSLVSYNLIKDDQRELDLATGSVYLNYCSNLLETHVISSSRETFSQILTNLGDNDYFNYYLHNSPFEKNNLNYLSESSHVRLHLQSIRESTDLMKELSIFYVDNQLLISGSEVKYDAYFDFRKDELSQYNQIVNAFQDGTESTFLSYVINDNTLRICRPVYIGTHIEALVCCDFSIHDIIGSLETYLWDSNVDILMLDAGGLVMADTSMTYTGQNIADIPYFGEELGQSDIGNYTSSTDVGENIVSYITRGDYCYLSVIPTTSYTDATDFLLINILISFLVAFGVGLLLSILVAILHTRRVSSVMNLIDVNEPELAVKNNIYEVIHAAFAKMIDTVEVQNKELASVIPALQEKFVLWFFSRMPSDADEIHDNMEMMRVEFRHPTFVILAVKPEHIGTADTSDDYDIEFGSSELLDVLESNLNTDDSFATFCQKENTLWGIVNFSCGYDTLVSRLKDIDFSSLHRRVFLSLGAPCETLSTLSADLSAIGAGLGYSFLYPEQTLCTSDAFHRMEAIGAAAYAAEYKLALKAIKRGDGESAAKALTAFVDAVRTGGCRLQDVLTMLTEFAVELEKYDAGKSDLHHELECASHNIHAYCAVLERCIERELTKEKAVSSASGKLAALARAYIDTHLTDNQISLQHVADELGINAAYLSAIFADTYDVTFIEYLTECRINYAKDLLSNTDKPLAEIAELLNYSSSKYFISRFKSYCGVTPTVFRRQTRGEQTSEESADNE